MGLLRSAAHKLAGFSLAYSIRAWMSTLRYEVACYDNSLDPAMPNFQGPAIYLFWHEYISFMFYLRGHCGVVMLLSQHRDAEALAHAARMMGFGTVRGSSNRGGTRALRAMLERGGSNLTMTPDGPRGPRRTLAPGCVYLSSRLSIPLVPMGLAYERPWRIRRAWDQHAVPRPFSRACAVLGPRLQIPADADRDQLEQYRGITQEWLNDLSDRAQAWADGQYRLTPAHTVHRMPKPLRYQTGPVAAPVEQTANHAEILSFPSATTKSRSA